MTEVRVPADIKP